MIDVLALAVHVAGERDVAEIGEPLGAVFRIRVKSGAPVDHENPRPAVAARLVGYQYTRKVDFAVSVVNSVVCQ